MSKKYVIEINDGEDNICINGENDNAYYTRVVRVSDLEELTHEYFDKNRIEVGDVVKCTDGFEYVVVNPRNGFGNACGFTKTGMWVGYDTDSVVKTDKHFDIKSILEDM